MDVSFYSSREDATLERNERSGTAYESAPGQLFARIEANNQCQGVDIIPLIVDEFPEIILQESYQICATDAILDLEANDTADRFMWYAIDDAGNENLIDSQQTISLTEEGNYRLELFSDYENPQRSCSNTQEFSVSFSFPPEIEKIQIEPQHNLYRVEVLTSNSGVFEYQLGENSGFQNSSIFSQVSPGNYLLLVREV